MKEIDVTGLKKFTRSFDDFKDNKLQNLEDKTIDDVNKKVVLPITLSIDKIDNTLNRLLDFLTEIKNNILNIDWNKIILTLGTFVVIVVVAIKSPQIIDSFSNLIANIS